MSSTQEDLFWAAAESAGLPAAFIAAARNDPFARSYLESLLAQDAPSAFLQPVVNLQQHGSDLSEMEGQVQRARRAFQASKNSPLSQPLPRDRHRLIVSMNAQRDGIVRGSVDFRSLIVTSYMGFPKYFSEKSLADLRRISFSDMFTTQVHEGRYLLCRIVSRPILQLGVSFMVEDPTGRTEYFSIYHSPLHGTKTGPDLDALFPLGQTLAVKEPLFKTNQDGSSQLIRVDSPPDLVFLYPNDPLLASIRWTFPSPAEPLSPSFDHKAHGNTYFKQKKYLLAVEAYTAGLALSSSDQEKLLLQLNRAQAHLILRNFASAYYDAVTVLSLLDEDVNAPPQTKPKATLRRARALSGLRRLEEAKVAFEDVLELEDSSAEAKQGKRSVDKMVREAKTGEYDWLLLEAQAEGAHREGKLCRELEVGDYLGPIKMARLVQREGGRGVVAARDIAAGEVLLVENAYAVGGGDSTDKSVILASDVRLNQVSPPSPCIDTARIEAISAQNRFGLRSMQDGSPSALFLRASLFNHSCVGNSDWHIIGDVIVVRARAPIPVGEEILMSYISAAAPASQRRDNLKAHFGPAGCPCELCSVDARLGPAHITRREELTKKLAELKPKPASDPLSASQKLIAKRKLAALIAQLETTYTSSFAIKPVLVMPYYNLATLCDFSTTSGASESQQYARKALTVSGTVLVEGGETIKVVAVPVIASFIGPTLLLIIAHSFDSIKASRNKKKAKQYVKAAMEMSRMLFGSELRDFLLRYLDPLDDYNLHWAVHA
ncbi:hypothetical protein JCM11641_007228 [Rhodosporidiobolus odoratus]